ncbi:MAG: HAMP domain-containing histidine kinase [Acidobacteriia bacterium]|nr:HAMP domain-containing histidine kinase [Terriglobia bacterium]
MNARTFNEPARVLPDITSIVHDLRNPLSTIHGSAEVLISSRLSEPQVHRIARNMYGASVRMKEMLDEVLTRFRGTERGVEPSDLRELVTSAVDKIALAAEAQSVQIVQDVPEHLVIPLDRQRIQRVLVNLLVNALDVMPDGGTASGLGLGLAFSRQAVIDHGGRMWLESSGAGACFAFCLPRTGRLESLLA